MVSVFILATPVAAMGAYYISPYRTPDQSKSDLYLYAAISVVYIFNKIAIASALTTLGQVDPKLLRIQADMVNIQADMVTLSCIVLRTYLCRYVPNFNI